MIGTAQEKRFAILGHRDTTETGLDPTRFRMFSSTQGRWLSKDPKAGQVCNPQTLNRYAYVRNSPANLIDPRGQTEEIGVAVASLGQGMAVIRRTQAVVQTVISGD